LLCYSAAMYKDPEKQSEAERRCYECNKELYRQKNDKKRACLKELLIEAKNVPCMDCGGRFPPYVMDVDHRDPSSKEALVGHLVDSLSVPRRSADRLVRSGAEVALPGRDGDWVGAEALLHWAAFAG
jgi:hypothetical protein